MIDFWELTGRLLLMDKTKRKTEIYDPTGLLPIQPDGCILLGHANSTTLPFKAINFYNPLRRHFLGTEAAPGLYRGQMMSPILSMHALGEVGVMLFNEPFRDQFEELSDHVRTASAINGRKDTGSYPAFYIALTVIAMDTHVRDTVAVSGDFQGLPVNEPDSGLLRTLAQDPVFKAKADKWCFGTAAARAPWTDGSSSTLNIQEYATATPPRPFRHFRFINVP